MTRRGGERPICITVEGRSPKPVLAVYMGARWMAATVNSNNPKPKFYGKGLRGVKGHYFWLRRTLALKKAHKTFKRVGQGEGPLTVSSVR